MANKLLILVIESDSEQLAAMTNAIAESGHDTVVAEDGVVGMRQFFSSHPDIVVIGLDLAELTGWELIRQMRTFADTPIIVTAPEATVASLQRGLDLRIEGFLVKPFAPEELIVRINALSGRISGEGGQERWLYEENGVVINWRSCEVFVEGERVDLTGTEFKLLGYLAQRRGWVLSHDQILSEVWGPEYVGEKNRIKLYIWYLRQKIEREPSKPRLIVTKRGLGYTFVG